MKKITLSLVVGLIVSFAGNAQVDELYQGQSLGNFTNNAMVDCTFEVANDNLYGGAINSAKYASRFIVDQGESFQASDVTLLLGVVNDPSYVIDGTTELKFTVYSDTGVGPDVEITSAINTPTSATFVQTITLTSGAVWDLYEVEVDLSDFDLISGSSTNDTPFFFGIEMTQDDGVQVGLNFTLAATGSITYFDNGGGWTVFNASAPDDLSFTYLLEGECQPLSVSDNLTSQIAIYPTPAVDVINIKTPATLEINEVVLFDLQGRNTGAVFSNGTVNVSGLSRGVYLLTVKTSEGTLTQKVVKK